MSGIPCAGWRGGEAIGSPPIFKPRSWSGARETAVEMERLFKAVTPSKEAARALLRPPFLRGGGGVWQRLAESALCAKLGAFVLLFRSENTPIRTRECLFRELMGSNRWEMES